MQGGGARALGRLAAAVGAARQVAHVGLHDREGRVRLAQVAQIAERGIDRGDLRPDTDPELLTEVLFGPVYYRLLLSGAPLDAGLADRVVVVALAAFGRT